MAIMWRCAVSLPFVPLLLVALAVLTNVDPCEAHCVSEPYVPFRTDPFYQPKLENNITWGAGKARRTSKETRYLSDTSNNGGNSKCPLSFHVGLSHHHSHSHHAESDSVSSASGIHTPPVTYPVHTSEGPGRDIVYTTDYEHLDLLVPMAAGSLNKGTTVLTEMVSQDEAFPLLFESSSFYHTHPIVYDVNADGIPDAIVSDYDGGVYNVGLDYNSGSSTRYISKAQIPRLYVRKSWYDVHINYTAFLNDTQDLENPENKDGEHKDPFHSYFEWSSVTDDKDVLRGVSGNVLGQGADVARNLDKRKKENSRKAQEEINEANVNKDLDEDSENRRRLQEVTTEENPKEQDMNLNEKVHHEENNLEESHEGEATGLPHEQDLMDDITNFGDDVDGGDVGGDDMYHDRFGMSGDDLHPGGNYGYDDMYMNHHGNDYKSYYDEEYYFRLPPHLLGTPAFAEVPKNYRSETDAASNDVMLYFPVTYYLDEDEYDGLIRYKRFNNKEGNDHTPEKRGQFVANAMVSYNLSGKRWVSKIHLDLSSDYSSPQNNELGTRPIVSDDTRMGAFVLGTPTVANLDGTGNYEVLMGTSMGLIYSLDSEFGTAHEGFPVQMRHPIENRILVEDVMGDTNLEIFAMDNGGNIVCLSHKGETLWHRDIVATLSSQESNQKVRRLSPMTLGDVDGDGTLDIVFIAQMDKRSVLVYAIQASTGDDVVNFPIRIELPTDKSSTGKHWGEMDSKIPQPLLVDLHSDQSSWISALQGSTTKLSPKLDIISTMNERAKSGVTGHGGTAKGLHIVQPLGSNVYTIEAGSGCIQTVNVGSDVAAMVQVDDVHGNGSLDLIVTTASGNVITLESPSVPYHPLNVWNGGDVRSGRQNNFAQGYGASQGIFVHKASRQYRDILGVFIPITFEIFDHRPGIAEEKSRQGLSYLLVVPLITFALMLVACGSTKSRGKMNWREREEGLDYVEPEDDGFAMNARYAGGRGMGILGR
eukprot:scaffold30465_cov51-Attheya_sp.AAC.2